MTDGLGDELMEEIGISPPHFSVEGVWARFLGGEFMIR